MHYVHTNRGTCSSQVSFDIENGILHNVKYIGGCNGNLKALGALVEGMRVEDVIEKLHGIKCGFKATSCSDQLANALIDITKKQETSN